MSILMSFPTSGVISTIHGFGDSGGFVLFAILVVLVVLVILGVSAKVVFWDTPAECTCKTPLFSLCKHKGVLGEVV